MYRDHVILDFEMNPVHSQDGQRSLLQNEIIEIGAVKLSGDDFRELSSFEEFVKPERGRSISHKITELTGITDGDVANARVFSDVLADFEAWIGNKPVRIYSWSNTDRAQLVAECREKLLEFPSNMSGWTDFQAVFPRVIGMYFKRQMSLEYALELSGVEFDRNSVHRALYDARVTAELVRMVLSGEHKKRLSGIKDVLVSPNVEPSTYSIANSDMGSMLMSMLSGMDK